MTKDNKFNRKQSHSLWNATKDGKGNVMVHRTQAEREDLEDFEFLEAKVANSLGLWGASLTDINDFQNLPRTIRDRFSIVAKEMQQEGEVPPKVMSWGELNSAFEGEKVASVKNKIVYGMKTRQASKVLDVPFIMAADLLEDYEKIGKTAMKDIVDTYKKDAGFGNMVDYGVDKVKDWGNRQVDNLTNTVNEFAEDVQNVPGEIVDNLVPQWLRDAWNYGEDDESVTASKKAKWVSDKITDQQRDDFEKFYNDYFRGQKGLGTKIRNYSPEEFEDLVISFYSEQDDAFDDSRPDWKNLRVLMDYDDESVTASKKSADSDDDLKMAVMNELKSLPPVSDRKLLSIFIARGWDREEVKNALPYVISELEGEGVLTRDDNENLVIVDGKEAAVRQYGKVAKKVFNIMATQCPKVAVDAKAEEYWKAYYGPYGEQLVKEVKKRIKADLAKIWLMKQGVDEAAAKYWQNYFTDENYGEELTKDIPKRLSPKAKKRAQEDSGVDVETIKKELESYSSPQYWNDVDLDLASALDYIKNDGVFDNDDFVMDQLEQADSLLSQVLNEFDVDEGLLMEENPSMWEELSLAAQEAVGINFKFPTMLFLDPHEIEMPDMYSEDDDAVRELTKKALEFGFNEKDVLECVSNATYGGMGGIGVIVNDFSFKNLEKTEVTGDPLLYIRDHINGSGHIIFGGGNKTLTYSSAKDMAEHIDYGSYSIGDVFGTSEWVWRKYGEDLTKDIPKRLSPKAKRVKKAQEIDNDDLYMMIMNDESSYAHVKDLVADSKSSTSRGGFNVKFLAESLMDSFSSLLEGQDIYNIDWRELAYEVLQDESLYPTEFKVEKPEKLQIVVEEESPGNYSLHVTDPDLIGRNTFTPSTYNSLFYVGYIGDPDDNPGYDVGEVNYVKFGKDGRFSFVDYSGELPDPDDLGEDFDPDDSSFGSNEAIEAYMSKIAEFIAARGNLEQYVKEK